MRPKLDVHGCVNSQVRASGFAFHVYSAARERASEIILSLTVRIKVSPITAGQKVERKTHSLHAVHFILVMDAPQMMAIVSMHRCRQCTVKIA